MSQKTYEKVHVMNSSYQYVLELASNSLSVMCSTRTNQLGMALYMSGVSDLKEKSMCHLISLVAPVVPPAEGVAVTGRTLVNKAPILPQHLHNVLVRILQRINHFEGSHAPLADQPTFTCWPLKWETSSVKRPLRSTGQRGAMSLVMMSFFKLQR